MDKIEQVAQAIWNDDATWELMSAGPRQACSAMARRAIKAVLKWELTDAECDAGFKAGEFAGYGPEHPQWNAMRRIFPAIIDAALADTSVELAKANDELSIEALRARVEAAEAERDALLAEWNAMVVAIGAPKHGTAIAHAAALKADAEKLRDALEELLHAASGEPILSSDLQRARDALASHGASRAVTPAADTQEAPPQSG